MANDKPKPQPKKDTNPPKPQPSKPKEPQGEPFRKSRDDKETRKLNK